MREPRSLAPLLAASWWMALLGLIVAASLWPSHLELSPAHLAARWRMWRGSFHWVSNPGWHEQRDLVTNFLLYLPAGVVAPWLLAGVRPLLRRPWALAALAVAGPLLSLAMELAQVATANRYPSALDWAMNSLGYGCGFMLAAGVIAGYRLKADIFLGARGETSRAQWAAALRMFYLPLLGLAALLPLDLQVGAQAIWRKLTGDYTIGFILLDPLNRWTDARLAAVALTFVMLLPFGFLTALIHPQGRPRAWTRLALLGLLLAFTLEAMQIFVASRTSDLAEVLAGMLGALAGGLLARVWDGSPAAAGVASPTPSRGEGLLLASGGYGLFLWLLAWWPLMFLPTPRAAFDKLRHETNWAPFWLYTSEHSLANFVDFARETAWWLPLGMLLTAWLARRNPGGGRLGRLAVMLAIGGTLGVFVELGQCMVVGRYVDVTDILGHGLGLLAGGLLAELLSAVRHAPAGS